MSWGASLDLLLLQRQLVGLVLFALTMGLAALLFHRVRNTRAGAVFALFLLLRGLANLVAVLRASSGAVEDVDLWHRLQPYFFIPLPFLIVAFAATFPRPRGWLGSTRGLALLGAGAVVGEVLFALDHRLWFTYVVEPFGTAFRAQIVGTGPLFALLALLIPTFAVVALLLTRDAARAPPGPSREAQLLVALGLALDPLFLGVLMLMRGLVAGLPVDFGWRDGVGNALWIGAVALPIAGLWMLHRAGSRDPALGRAARTQRAMFAIVAGSACVSGAAYAVWPRPDAVLLHANLDAVWTFAQPALVTYALLRHRLFDFELRVKRTLRASTIVGAFAGLFFLGSEAARAVAPGASVLVGLAGALALFVALQPLQQFADRLAERALPRVEASAGYLNLRKLDVYRAALEDAARGGSVPAAETPTLAALRAELGLSERDHAVLALALQHRGAAPSAGLPLQPGEKVLGRYVIERPLGAGAHGATYLAEDLVQRRRVALKTLRPEVGADPGTLREARAHQRVQHPCVVVFHELALEGPQPYLVMEYVEGGALRERLAHGSLEPAAFRRVAADLLAALEAVHATGHVHRDVKPSNVLLTADGRAKLGDFGIAHTPGLETTAGAGGDLASAVGTVRYMSPEQARGRRTTPRSDLYSAAATLFEAWTGEAWLEPLPGESAVELQMRAAAAGPFRRNVKGPPALRTWFAKALHPDPAKRFADAREMRDALDRAFR